MSTQPPDERDDLYYATVRRLMEAHAWRVLGAARLLGHGVQHVRSIRWMKVVLVRAREAVDHYETIGRMYEAFAAQSLEPVVLARLAERPPTFTQDALELALANFLYGRSAWWIFREHEQCSFVPYREVVLRIARDLGAQQASAEKMLAEALAEHRAPAEGPLRDAHLERWLRLSLSSFGRPNTPGSGYALATGLRRRDAGMVIRDYLADVLPHLQQAGVSVPALGGLGLDLPSSLVGGAQGPEDETVV
jgi:1,2-phenylacetyl-CoA epoxidase catalytic subunit